jgi:hypothetical protein
MLAAPTNLSDVAPANVTMTAVAAGTVPVSSVAFYTNGTWATTLHGPSFSYQVSGLPTGSYTLQVWATNALDQAAASATANFTVTNMMGLSVTLVSPVSFTRTAPAYVTLQATVAGTYPATNVAFYNTNGTLYTNLTSAPFSNWMFLSATSGVWGFYAMATNSQGEAARSATNYVTLTNRSFLVVTGVLELQAYVGSNTLRYRTNTFVCSTAWTNPVTYLLTNVISLTNNGGINARFFAFAMSNIPPTTTWISVKNPWSLRRKMEVIYDDTGLARLMFTNATMMMGGDISGLASGIPAWLHDNKVNISDFNAFKVQNGKALPWPIQADVNGDGKVNVADFNIFRPMGKQGDPQ